jgi:hypothetical protein
MTISEALANLLRVVDLDPVGYIYDEKEAECVGCEGKAPTMAGVVHTDDCLQGAVEIGRTALGVR